MTTDQTITVTVKPEIDREAVEEAARAAAALFLSSFAVAVLEGVAAEEPPEEVLKRVKAETLEKASHEAQQKYEDMIFHPQPATDAPGPAQTLADLEPCLGDRVRVGNSRMSAAAFGWLGTDRGYGWRVTDSRWRINSPESWTVLEHLDPVTPEEPPVGAGMLVDVSPPIRREVIWNREESGWRLWVDALREWSVPVTWAGLMDEGFRFRPATPADLARHGVDEQGEPVGKGEPAEPERILIPRSIFPSQDTLWTIAEELDEDHAKVAARIIRDLAEQFALAQFEAEAGDRG